MLKNFASINEKITTPNLRRLLIAKSLDLKTQPFYSLNGSNLLDFKNLKKYAYEKVISRFPFYRSFCNDR